MYSIGFPTIFNGSTVNLYKDYTAIKSNLRNLLASERGMLMGDPHYGTALKQIIFHQSVDPLIKELIRDEVFEAINSYMPQVTIYRDKIDVIVSGNVVSVSIYVSIDEGKTFDALKIDLLTNENE